MGVYCNALMASEMQPPRYEQAPGHGSGSPEVRDPDLAETGVRDAGLTPTHQAMARTAPPRRTGPVVAAVGITLALGLVGAWLWVAMGPWVGIGVLTIGVILLLVMMTALRGRRQPQHPAA